MRRSIRILSRTRESGPRSMKPFGQALEQEYPRTEQNAARLVRGPTRAKWADTRFVAKGLTQKQSRCPGLLKYDFTPRDIGELPRNYALKMLLMNQPATSVTLFELMKMRSDCPVDSREHLEEVLRMSQEQNWVYREKNQADGHFYYYVHKSRVYDVQEFVRQGKESLLREEKEEERRQSELEALVDAERKEALKSRIVQLQNTLLSNYCKIKEYDPETAERLPFVTPSGAVDFTWHLQQAEK